jgi:hypothetical protein
MEHASIAAFARFALQLLGMGAPPELVSGAQRAMADETEHAQLAFALASAYAGSDVGPGPLPINGALDGGDLRGVIGTLIREGCIGETIAAIEAMEARKVAVDPAVRAVLGKIAGDEARHAELAWLTLSWVTHHHPYANAIASEEFAAAVDEARAKSLPAERDGLLEYGILGAALSHQLRFAALENAIVPCAKLVLHSACPKSTRSSACSRPEDTLRL